MRYFLSLIVLMFFMSAQANENYPLLYEKQGTPLFKAADSFSLVKTSSVMQKAISDYKDEAEKTKNIGIKVDESSDKKAIYVYLKLLRTLQNKHDKIITLAIKILRNTIKSNDYQEFSNSVNFGMNYYRDKVQLKEQIISYYKKNRSKGKIALLDKIIKYDKDTITYYDESERIFKKENYSNRSQKKEKKVKKEIILLSSKGCPYCVKAKKLLNRSGKPYTELNTRSSKGAKLYKKYNGRGVPMIIVDGRVIRGYDPQKILREIQ